MVAHRQRQHNNASPIIHRVTAMQVKRMSAPPKVSAKTQGECDHLSNIPATLNDDAEGV